MEFKVGDYVTPNTELMRLHQIPENNKLWTYGVVKVTEVGNDWISVGDTVVDRHWLKLYWKKGVTRQMLLKAIKDYNAKQVL